MTDYNLQKKLDLLNKKLDLFLGGLSTECNCPYKLHDLLDMFCDVTKPVTLSKQWLNNLKRYTRKIKALLENKALNNYTALELSTAIYSISQSYTRSACYEFLNAVFNYAIKLGYISCNPLQTVPKPYHKRQTGQALTIAEQQRFIKALEGNELKPLYMFYLLTGCRCSELLALKWSDIDLDTMQIHIRGTKTANANRYIPIFTHLKPFIDELPKSNVNYSLIL